MGTSGEHLGERLYLLQRRGLLGFGHFSLLALLHPGACGVQGVVGHSILLPWKLLRDDQLLLDQSQASTNCKKVAVSNLVVLQEDQK